MASAGFDTLLAHFYLGDVPRFSRDTSEAGGHTAIRFECEAEIKIMGGKKQLQKVFTGSLRSHWIRYINKIDLKLNPADLPSKNTANLMLKTVHKVPSHFV